MEREPIPSQILLLAKALDPNVAVLVDAMTAQGVPVASALGVLRQMQLVREGGTPYKLAASKGIPASTPKRTRQRRPTLRSSITSGPICPATTRSSRLPLVSRRTSSYERRRRPAEATRTALETPRYLAGISSANHSTSTSAVSSRWLCV